jgi:Mrp family chromosome partitioning ATPase
MPPRTIGLHVFCSAKGGVGKSTLAVAAAKLLADRGRTCVLVDADLTGTPSARRRWCSTPTATRISRSRPRAAT